jgi:hypothetical protein
MAQQFYYGIEASLLLLQQWVAAAFPAPRDNEQVGKLHGIWLALGKALCGSDMKKRIAFTAATLRPTGPGREGDPPIHALEQQLRKLEKAGMQEGFLAVALCEATEVLIARDFPDKLDQWTQLADQFVIKETRFSLRDDQMASSNKVTYSPDM